MAHRRAVLARRALHCVFAVTMVAGVLVAVAGPQRPASALTPDPAVTPGQVDEHVTQTSIATTVCVPGYVAWRARVSSATADRVYAAYRVSDDQRDEYTLTPLIPVEVGGTASSRNLWPRLHGQGVDDSAWVAAVRRHMCHGRFALSTARSFFPDRSTWQGEATPPTAPASSEPTTTTEPDPTTSAESATTTTSEPEPTTTEPEPTTTTTTTTTTSTSTPSTTTTTGPKAESADPDPTTTTTTPATTAPKPITTTLGAPTTTTRPPVSQPKPSSTTCSGGWLTTPIPSDPVLDPSSSTWSRLFTSGSRALIAYDYSAPVYVAQPSDPRQTIVIDNEPEWGTNALSQQKIPVPAALAPSPGTDGKIEIVDPVARVVYDLWMAERDATGTWHAAWGGVYSLDSDCTSPHPDYSRGETWPTFSISRGTGSGISTLGGMVTLADIRKGSIDHTLVFATDVNAANTFRFPATSTDGSGDGPIPEGARIQLDPSVEISPAWPKYAQMVAKALQTYGAVAVDNGGCRVCISREMPKPTETDPYPSVDASSWYDDLSMIPWSKIQVLASWNGR